MVICQHYARAKSSVRQNPFHCTLEILATSNRNVQNKSTVDYIGPFLTCLKLLFFFQKTQLALQFICPKSVKQLLQHKISVPLLGMYP